MLSVVMYVFRVSISLFCGYPKSLISGNWSVAAEKYWWMQIPSMSSYISTKLFLIDSSSILPKYDLQMLINR